MSQSALVRCQRCHRVLKNPVYQRIGYGKVCLGKAPISTQEKELLEQQMNDLLEELKKEKLEKKKA